MDAEPDDLFERLTGHAMNRWQARLLEQLRAGCFPDALDLPTGLGKTAIIPLWLVARLLGAPVPRRLVYIVDRRAVVDQATTLADRMSEVLAADDAADLRSALGLGHQGRLSVSTLRGQHADNRQWLQDPSRPAIIVGTVDMIGSRLLFEGYGVSRWQRSMHAALLARDSLVVLDESHLVPPFDHLLGDLVAFVAHEPVMEAAPPMRVLRLSATGNTAGKTVFSLADDDMKDPWIARRVKAPKWLRLWDVAAKDLVTGMVERAVALAGDNGRVVIFSSTFTATRQIVDELTKWWRSDPSRRREPAPVARLTGQTRVAERAQLAVGAVFGRFTGYASGTGPAFLVATSAGEVGVDFDAAHLVCDMVAWERMVQRLGRVNRAGRPDSAMVEVLCVDVADDTLEAHARSAFEHHAWARNEAGGVDVSPLALRDTPASDGALAELVDQATTPEPWRPAFNRHTLGAWSMTSLDSHAGRPKVSPWLRGWPTERDVPDATLIWRRWLPSHQRLEPYLDAAPPHLLEGLTTSTTLIAAWLANRLKAIGRQMEEPAPSSDVPGANDRRTWLRHLADPQAPTCIAISVDVDGRGTAIGWSELLRDAARPAAQRRIPLPGATLIVDARLGGLDDHGVLDAKSAEPVRVWDALPADDGSVRVAVNPLFDAVPRRLRRGTLCTARPGYVRLDYLDGDELELERDPPEGRWVERLIAAVADERSGESEALIDHQARVVVEVARFADALGVPARLGSVLCLSAAHHDEGKAVDHWQSSMGIAVSERPLAKTGGSRRTGSLQGYRHEFGSYLAVKRIEAFARLDEDDQDLVLHLIASHHGRARPWIHPFDPDKPPAIDRLAAPDDERSSTDIAVRFDRLQRRYGHYGLAWLECLLRAADWSASSGRDRTAAP